ncbi:MAG: aldo/keto reductase, partial [Promethearchaeota archaeon]
ETSEIVVGKALQDGYRDRIKLATKLPIWKVEKPEDFELLLDEQLKKLQTDHVDFYLFHAINRTRWEQIQSMGLLKKMELAKKQGKILHIGFSFHDSILLFKDVIDSFDWDMCQIQFNYLDENYQAGKEGLQYAAAKGIAVVVMEPLRGGKLVESNPEIEEVLHSASSQHQYKLPELGFRWVWNHPEVSLVLSGMNSIAMVEENIKSADLMEPNSMSNEEIDLISKLKKVFNKKIMVPCTFCEYCMPCPNGVAIPVNFQAINLLAWGDNEEWARNVYSDLAKTEEQLLEKPNRGNVGLCIKCGECLPKCPQGIDIPTELEKVSEVFGKNRSLEEIF